jgi:hypothetical protein
MNDSFMSSGDMNESFMTSAADRRSAAGGMNGTSTA